MTRHDEHHQAKEISDLWALSEAPTASRAEDQLAERQRAKRMVAAIGDAILSERRQPPRWRSRALSGLALAASLFGAVVAGRVLLREPAPSLVTGGSAAATPAESLGGVEASGIVTLKRGRAPSVVDVAAVHAGDRITTAVKATARLTLGKTVRASVGEASEVSVEAQVTSTHRLRLDSGRLDATVDGRASAEPKLVVETPDVQVVVTGTVLGVEVSRPGQGTGPTVTRVSVTEGHVEVRKGGERVATVSAGETWSSMGGPVAVVPPSVSGEAVVEGLGRPGPSRNGPPEGPPVTAHGTLAVENALFEAAIGARKRGSPHVALAHLEDLLDRYPSSPLAAEARLERMRALEKLGRREAAAREARKYLSAPPGSAVRLEAERLLEGEASGATRGEGAGP